MKFKRVAAAFDEAARQWSSPWDSNGSEYWPEELGESGNLSDLVNSYIDGDDRDHSHHSITNQDGEDDVEAKQKDECDHDDDDNVHGEYYVDHERKDKLMRLLSDDERGGGDTIVMQRVRGDVEAGCRVVGKMMGGSTVGFKRRLMAHLRELGYDAGLCKTRWEKMPSHPAGDYEYIDINIAGTRYIIEFFLAGEFQIARPTVHYASLLGTLPSVLILKPETLKQIVRLMTAAMKESLKSAELHIPPWRRNCYMMAKWFEPYKRTNTIAMKMAGVGGVSTSLLRERSVGFETRWPEMGNFCRDDFASKVGLRVGQLAAAFHEG
ncbi:hypothetical protein Droror1_Dr00005481 [Drosera rotundifolia]